VVAPDVKTFSFGLYVDQV